MKAICLINFILNNAAITRNTKTTNSLQTKNEKRIFIKRGNIVFYMYSLRTAALRTLKTVWTDII